MNNCNEGLFYLSMLVLVYPPRAPVGVRYVKDGQQWQEMNTFYHWLQQMHT